MDGKKKLLWDFLESRLIASIVISLAIIYVSTVLAIDNHFIPSKSTVALIYFLEFSLPLVFPFCFLSVIYPLLLNPWFYSLRIGHKPFTMKPLNKEHELRTRFTSVWHFYQTSFGLVSFTRVNGKSAVYVNTGTLISPVLVSGTFLLYLAMFRGYKPYGNAFGCTRMYVKV